MGNKEQDQCRYCHQKAVILDDGYFDKWESQIKLVSGGWTALYIGVNSDGETVMRACGDDYTDDYFPQYCPECGRKLR